MGTPAAFSQFCDMAFGYSVQWPPVSTVVLFSSMSLRSVSLKCPLSVDTKSLIVVGECGFHEKPCVGICRDSCLWLGVWLSGHLREWTVHIAGRDVLIWETMAVSVRVNPVTSL